MQDSSNNEYRKAEKLIEQEQYVNAVNVLNSILDRNPKDAYGYFLKGKAHCQRQRYKLALNSYEMAFDLYTKQGNKKYRAYTFLEIHNSNLYFFNGRIQEAPWTYFQLLTIAEDLNLADIPRTDVLYPYVEEASNMSKETFDSMKSAFSSRLWINNRYFGLFGKLIGYRSRGKTQCRIVTFLFVLTFSLPIICTALAVYFIAKLFEITIFATLFYFFIASTITKLLISAIAVF